ncbi:MAG: M56 family metallopeptidase [Bryobacteraceae bacterium]
MTPAILRHLAESTLFAAIVVCVNLYLLRRGVSRPATRHGLWLLAFVKFAIPTALLSAAGASLASLLSFRPIAAGAFVDLSRLLFRAGRTPTIIVAMSHHDLSMWVVAIWLTGSLILLVNWIRRLRNWAVTLAPAGDAERNAFEKAKHQLGIRNNVRLGISGEVAEPHLRGIVRSTLVMPRRLSLNLTTAELEAVMLHEMAHLRRRDNLVNSIAHALCLVCWFHPLLWWMKRQLLIDCECACDQLVVETIETPRDYVSGILKVCRFAFADPLAGVSGIGGWKLKQRLELIMSYHNNQSRFPDRRRLLGAAAAILLLIPIAGGFLSRSVLEAQTAQKRKGIEFINATMSGNSVEDETVLSALTQTLNPNEMVFNGGSGPYGNWLNDVALIITPHERAAFLELTSAQEREKFIAQFWERQNPNPGAQNPFKEEYYRRLAFANKHYTKHDVSGWQTDRGRTYIILGPPDEIDSHPDDKREMWRYRKASGTPDDLFINFDISDQW